MGFGSFPGVSHITKHLGPEHIDMLTIMGLLGVAYNKLDRRGGAEQIQL